MAITSIDSSSPTKAKFKINFLFPVQASQRMTGYRLYRCNGSEISLNPVNSLHADEWIWKYCCRTTGFVEVSVNIADTILSQSSAVATIDESAFCSLSVNWNAVEENIQVDQDQEYYDVDSVITITAFPNPGYQFSHWTGDFTSGQKYSNPMTLTIKKDSVVTCNMVLQKGAISATIQPQAAVTDGAKWRRVGAIPAGKRAVSVGFPWEIIRLNFGDPKWFAAENRRLLLCRSDIYVTATYTGKPGHQVNIELQMQLMKSTLRRVGVHPGR